MKDLFREEVLSKKNRIYTGDILISNQKIYSFFTIFSLLLIIIFILFCYFFTYEKKTQVNGVLVPDKGVIKIYSSTNGVLAQISIREGDEVKKGQQLFVIQDNKKSIAGKSQVSINKNISIRKNLLEEEINLYNKKIESSKKSYENNLLHFDNEIRSIDEEIRISKIKEDIFHSQYKRYLKLYKSGYLALTELNVLELDKIGIESQKQSLVRQKVKLEREKAELENNYSVLIEQQKIEHHQLKNKNILLHQENEESSFKEGLIVVSPIDGIIAGINVYQGEKINIDSFLVSVIPQNYTLRGHLFLNSKQIGFVEEGQKITLHYEAFPYQKFGIGTGTIKYISKTPYTINELPNYVSSSILKDNQSIDTYFKVISELDSQFITIYGNEKLLIQGSKISAHLIQDRRYIYEWLFEPLYLLRQTSN